MRNLRAERDSAVLYDALAELEPDSRQRSVYHHLASAERRHAAFWEARLARAGQAIPPGLVAGASSMALGEWLSVTNARELALSQAVRDLGMQTPDASQPSVVLAGDAISVARWSFLLFALGAFVPLLPIGLLPSSLRVPGSIALSVAALFVLGLATSLFNARSPMFSGLRQVAIGAAAAAVTFVVGRLFGFLMGG